MLRIKILVLWIKCLMLGIKNPALGSLQSWAQRGKNKIKQNLPCANGIYLELMEYSLRKGYHKNITHLVSFHTLLGHKLARSHNPVAQTNPYLLSSLLNKP
jgi:hypothetical protein